MDDDLAELDQLLGSLTVLQKGLCSPPGPPVPSDEHPDSPPESRPTLVNAALVPSVLGISAEYDDSSNYCFDDVPVTPMNSDSSCAISSAATSNGHATIVDNTMLPPRMPSFKSKSNTAPSALPFRTQGAIRELEKRQDVAASKELDTLLQELSVIEKEMRDLERGGDDFTRRYSLASSTGKASCETHGMSPSPTGVPFSQVLCNNTFSTVTSASLNSSATPATMSSSFRTEEPDGGLPNAALAPSTVTLSTAPTTTTSDSSTTSPTTTCTTRSSIAGVELRKTHNSTGYVSIPRSATTAITSGKLQRETPFSLHEPSPSSTATTQQLANTCLKKVAVRVFHQDLTTKAVMVDERCTIRETCNILIAKNFCQPNVKLALVEKVPSMKMEHCFEDHESLAECILSWPIDSKNMIFFEEREDKYGLFLNPQQWLGPTLLDAGIVTDKHVKETVFGGLEPDLPEWNDFLYIRKPTEKIWSRKYCLVRNSGLYASKRKKSTSPCDLVRVMLFDTQFHLYTTTGGWTKWKAPTPYGFALKPYSAQDPHSKVIFYFCASDENAFKIWTTMLRIAKHGKRLMTNYQQALVDVERLRNEPAGLVIVSSSPSSSPRGGTRLVRGGVRTSLSVEATSSTGLNQNQIHGGDPPPFYQHNHSFSSTLPRALKPGSSQLQNQQPPDFVGLGLGSFASSAVVAASQSQRSVNSERVSASLPLERKNTSSPTHLPGYPGLGGGGGGGSIRRNVVSGLPSLRNSAGRNFSESSTQRDE